MPQDYRFPHHALIVWHLAIDARKDTQALIETLPRGYGEDARQLRRSCCAVGKLITEGASASRSRRQATPLRGSPGRGR